MHCYLEWLVYKFLINDLSLLFKLSFLELFNCNSEFPLLNMVIALRSNCCGGLFEQADGVYNQRLQNLAITLDKVRLEVCNPQLALGAGIMCFI